MTALRRGRLDQPCRAIIANEPALVRDEAELCIKPDGQVLIGKPGYDAIAAQAAMLSCRSGRVIDIAGWRAISGHIH
jgi:hypothetical protein